MNYQKTQQSLEKIKKEINYLLKILPKTEPLAGSIELNQTSSVEDFLKKHYIKDEIAITSAKQIYDDYVSWCRLINRAIVSKNKFGRLVAKAIGSSEFLRPHLKNPCQCYRVRRIDDGDQIN